MPYYLTFDWWIGADTLRRRLLDVETFYHFSPNIKFYSSDDQDKDFSFSYS